MDASLVGSKELDAGRCGMIDVLIWVGWFCLFSVCTNMESHWEALHIMKSSPGKIPICISVQSSRIGYDRRRDNDISLHSINNT